MKKVALILGVLLVLVCAIGSFAFKAMKEAQAAQEKAKTLSVESGKGDIVVSVVDSGTIDAVKSVEVKSNASGRLAKLLVDEGDVVTAGQLIAIIDPKETQLRVDSDRAQLQGAQSGAARTMVEIAQRRITAKADFEQAKVRLAQLQDELKIQPTLTNAAITSARTGLHVAQQQREQLLTNTHPNARTAAESSVREAEANFSNATNELKRQQDLLAKGYISTRSVENAQLQVDVARTRLDSARENLGRMDGQFRLEKMKADEEVQRAQAELDRAQANTIANSTKRREYQNSLNDVAKARAALRDVEVLQRQKEQSMATVQQLSSSLRESQRQLNETEIRAPLTGVVSKRFMQEGELVASLSGFSAGTPILRIEDRRTLRVKLEINEIDVAKLQLGMPATVKVDAYPDTQFKGILKKIAPASKSLGQAGGQGQGGDTVVKYEVEVWLDGTDTRLRSGMSATCTLETLRRNNVVYVPVEYLGSDDKGKFVQKKADSKVKGAKGEKIYVKVGATTGSRVEILSGVKEGVALERPDFSGPARKGMMQTGPDN